MLKPLTSLGTLNSNWPFQHQENESDSKDKSLIWLRS